MKKRITSLFMAVLMLLTVVSATAAAADDGLAPHAVPCQYCRVGTIRTSHTTKRVGNSPIRYLSHTVNGYLYACPVWQTQISYTKACDNPSCGVRYGSWDEFGEVIDHAHG